MTKLVHYKEIKAVRLLNKKLDSNIKIFNKEELDLIKISVKDYLRGLEDEWGEQNER